MRFVVDVWADDGAIEGPDDFWEVAAEAANMLQNVRGDDWRVRSVGLQTLRTLRGERSRDDQQPTVR